MSSSTIEVRGLTKSYGKMKVLRGVDLEVQQGQIVALVGENGVGKTTLLEILMGLRHAGGGEARILGHDVRQDVPAMRARIGFLSETVPFYSHMRLDEALRFHRSFFPDWDDPKAGELIRRLKLDPKAKVNEISRGQKLRFGLVCALSHHPSVMIFDEITAGMDPIVRADLVDLIHEEQRLHGSTVLFATNLLHSLKGFATHIAFLRDGRVDPVEEVDPAIVDLEQYFIDRHRERRSWPA